jgi:hypothetical protein
MRASENCNNNGGHVDLKTIVAYVFLAIYIAWTIMSIRGFLAEIARLDAMWTR